MGIELKVHAVAQADQGEVSCGHIISQRVEVAIDILRSLRTDIQHQLYLFQTQTSLSLDFLGVEEGQRRLLEAPSQNGQVGAFGRPRV